MRTQAVHRKLKSFQNEMRLTIRNLICTYIYGLEEKRLKKMHVKYIDR